MVERVHSKINTFSRRPGDPDTDGSIFLEVMQTFDNLNEIRLVERISRPLTMTIKEEIIDQFCEEVDQLHAKLARIGNEMGENHDTNTRDTTVKGRSVEVGSTQSQLAEWKKGIKTIEGRYYEVFIEGSFKHYPKISKLLHINRTIQVNDIQAWAKECLRKKNRSKECCDD